MRINIRKPPSDDIHAKTMKAKRAISSAVEHYVDIVGVTGSIPVLRTILL